jgi:hypothetical protein
MCISHTDQSVAAMSNGWALRSVFTAARCHLHGSLWHVIRLGVVCESVFDRACGSLVHVVHAVWDWQNVMLKPPPQCQSNITAASSMIAHASCIFLVY